MKKKATVLLALISMCLIATAGIGAVSASDEPVTGVTVYEINPDGTTTVIKTFEGNGPMVATATANEDGSINITKENSQISEDELFGGLDLDNPNVHSGTITPETELPMDIEHEDGCGITAEYFTLEPSEKIDVSGGRTLYKSCAWNYAVYPHLSVCVYSSNPNGGARTEASGNYVRWWVW